MHGSVGTSPTCLYLAWRVLVASLVLSRGWGCVLLHPLAVLLPRRRALRQPWGAWATDGDDTGALDRAWLRLPAAAVSLGCRGAGTGSYDEGP